jgi:PhoD-like phosphatase
VRVPSLLLGPMLRYADDECATVWVETDARCDVEVCGVATPTFAVAGHHYALVVVDGLTPGKPLEYSVRLDGVVVWPEPGSPFPPSVIRTRGQGEPLRLVFGSCRATRPNVPPYCLDKRADPRGMGADALRALALRMLRGEPAEWPHGLLLIGDQVYADEVSPQTLEFIRARRDTSKPPYEEVADFEEYTRLYQEAWSEPVVRWLLSVVPTAMIFDDHDVHDDWNTSDIWRRDHQRTSWWQTRVIGALSSYWLYQHLGNMAPPAIAAEGVLAQLQTVPDGWALLRDLAVAADGEVDGRKGHRWSYRRDRGGVRILVIDSRCGRVLHGRREMVNRREWDWIQQQATGDFDHLLLVSSLPVLLPASIHFLESWDEALCAGAWSGRFTKLGERLRQAVDLEHWGAFSDSFTVLMEMVAEITSGRRGQVPASVVFLSGDVHYAYLAEASFPPNYRVRSPVYQVVASPIRNPIQRSLQVADRFSRTRPARWFGQALARSAGVPNPPFTWEVTQGPWFENNLATLEMDGRELALTFQLAVSNDGDDPSLETAWAGELVRRPLPAMTPTPGETRPSG